MKFCNQCNTTKSLEDFSKNSSTKDGYHSECVSCTKKRGDRLRSQPGHSAFNHIKQFAKQKNIPLDGSIFSTYANFWNAFGDKWKAAEQRLNTSNLTIKRTDMTRGFYMSNLRVVEGKKKRTTAQPALPVAVEKFIPQDDTPSNEHMVELYRYVATQLQIDPEDLRKCHLKGLSLSLIENVISNVSNSNEKKLVIAALTSK